MKATEDAIRDRGPLGNSDFQQKRPGGAGWWSWKPVTHALHCLWMGGRTMIHSRRHFQKQYDLPERVLPAFANVEPLSAAEFARWHMRRTFLAMGAASETDLNWYMTFPRTRATVRRALLRRWYAKARSSRSKSKASAHAGSLREDFGQRARAGTRRTRPRAARRFAVDSFLWHRRARRFDYTIEATCPDSILLAADP